MKRENSYLTGKAVRQLHHLDILGIAKCLGAIFFQDWFLEGVFENFWLFFLSQGQGVFIPPRKYSPEFIVFWRSTSSKFFVHLSVFSDRQLKRFKTGSKLTLHVENFVFFCLTVYGDELRSQYRNHLSFALQKQHVRFSCFLCLNHIGDMY